MHKPDAVKGPIIVTRAVSLATAAVTAVTLCRDGRSSWQLQTLIEVLLSPQCSLEDTPTALCRDPVMSPSHLESQLPRVISLKAIVCLCCFYCHREKQLKNLVKETG